MFVRFMYRLSAVSMAMILLLGLVTITPQNISLAGNDSVDGNHDQQSDLNEFQRTHAQLVQESRASSGTSTPSEAPNYDLRSYWAEACETGQPAERGVQAGFCEEIATPPILPVNNGPAPDLDLPVATTELQLDFATESYDLNWYTAGLGGGGAYTPPDTMGAVGPTQFVVTQNGVYRFHNKITGAPDVSLDTLATAFWPASVDPGNDGGGDPRVRFDRLTDQWFIIAFTRNAAGGQINNRIIMARSDGPIISGATTWTYWYFIPKDTINGGADLDKFADYPTLGIDSNAYMVGGNMFGGIFNTTAWVIPKTTLPVSGGNAASVTHAFTGLLVSNSVYTPVPVDSYDSEVNSYFVAQRLGSSSTSFPLGTVTYSVGIPSLAWQNVSINTVNDSYAGLGIPYPGNPAPLGSGTNWGLDPMENKPIGGAHLRDGSIWFGVTNSVNGPAGSITAGLGDRSSVLVIEVSKTGAVLTDTNIRDQIAPLNADPTHVWMGSVVPNGQGHVVGGFTMTNTTDVAPSAGWSGRLASDPNGYFSQPEIFLAGTNTGNARQSFETQPRETRWGDYSMVTVDPCDDMTFYNIQEYQDTPAGAFGGNWATGFARILSLPPVVESSSANPFPIGSINATINITGTDLYDTPATASASCRTRLEASTTYSNLTINSITYNSPTSATLNMTSTSALCGTAVITVTNPDGQSDELSLNIGTQAQCGTVPPSNDNFANASSVVIGGTVIQDIGGATNEGTDPTLSCGVANYTNTVWFKYTATNDNVFAAQVTAAGFEPVITLLSGTTGDFNVLSCDTGSVVGGSLDNGQTYYVMVGNNSTSILTEPQSMELNMFLFPQNDALTLFNSGTEGISLIDTAQDNPPASSYTTFTQTPPINTNSRYVMGDWNADGVRTPGVFDNGVFQYTNDLGPSSNWSAGMWVGNPPSLQGIVTGRFEAGFANDCIGWVDGNTSPITGDLRFSLKRWCDMSATGAVALSAQFMGGVLGDSNGFVGTFSFVAGDWDGDSIDEMAVRRSDRITYTFIDPPSGAATFSQAQRWDTATATGPGGHTEDEGVFVGGDWDGNGTDSFGVVYSDAEFYYRNALSWNPGPWEFIFQGFIDQVGFDQASTTKTATGGNGPEFPFGPEGVPGNIAGAIGTGGGDGTVDTSQNVEADLSVSKAGNFQVGEVGLVGDTITWTITVTNTGTAPANSVQITDNVPSELRVDDALADLGTVTVQGQQVTFNVESLGVGQTAQFQVVTTILGQPSSGLFNNSVNVLLPEGDGSGSDANLIASSSVSSADGLPATGYAPKFRW